MVRSIPALQGIEGNERADRVAKEATGWRVERNHKGKLVPVDTENTSFETGGLQQPLSAFKGKLKTLVYGKWEQNWQRDQRGRVLFKIASEPSKKQVEIHSKFSRPLSSILAEMRTGHIGLRYFLYRRKIPGFEYGGCQCRQGIQTVAHILLSCPSFWKERNAWRNESAWSSDLRKILSEGKSAARAAKFILDTKLLGQFGSVETAV